MVLPRDVVLGSERGCIILAAICVRLHLGPVSRCPVLRSYVQSKNVFLLVFIMLLPVPHSCGLRPRGVRCPGEQEVILAGIGTEQRLSPLLSL